MVNKPNDLRKVPRETTPEVVSWLARWRVALGFVSAVFAYWLARSTWTSITIGLSVAAVGELIRIWASGHLAKAREITKSGPYRYVSHPLYFGSCIMGVGFAIATAAIVPAIIVGAYLALTIPSAMITEEAAIGHLKPGAERSFSVDRVMANREYRAIAGFMLGAALLVLRMKLKT
jgi:protein-S-isoprenylcysteine O-methyltransferase Ste14